MNARRKKIIKLLAARLPETKRIVVEGKAVLGCEIDNEIVSKSDILINPDQYYKLKQAEIKDVDHVKALKKAYNRNGNKGIINYIEWVDFNNKRLNKLYSDMQLEEVDKDIMDIISKGASSLWRNLLNFFFAFLKAFGKEAA